MKSILLIGVGQFGEILGEKLMNMGDQVMIVDKDENIINRLAPKFSNAVIANCMNADNLKALDIPSYDACVVTIADDFQSSLEITSILKDLGANYVVSKANTDIQRKFLFRVGADEVIYPNRDVAEKLAVKLNFEKVYDYIELDSTYSIFEIAVPDKWIGKSIMEANPRAVYGLNILTLKRDNQITPSPTADTVFESGDNMVVFGNTEKIIEFTNKFTNKKK
ncbi:MAG: TrkA family potassium uptake protein [Clostridia bacterium]|nr:TrkA family potassium uptake protein [Clostridia bacterium]